MKIFIIAVFLCLSFIGCKKDSLQKKIKGKWELRESYVGGSSSPFHQFAPGNGDTFEFTNSTYKADTSGQLLRSGNYSIIQDTMYSQIIGDKLILENYFSYSFVKIEGNIMKLTYEGRESSVFTYLKIE